jgi:hypothetical protein
MAPAGSAAWARAAQPVADQAVFLAGGLSDEGLIAFTANLAAAKHAGVVLLNTPQARPHQRYFLDAFRPKHVIPVGSFPEGLTELEQRLGRKTAPVMAWKNGPCEELWHMLFPEAEQVVVCPTGPRRLLLQAACLAGVLHAPLVVTYGTPQDAAELRRRLDTWHTRKIVAAGDAVRICAELPNVSVVRLKDADAVAASYLRHQVKRGAIHHVVVANPADAAQRQSHMSALAPWIALQKRAVLLLTDRDGTGVGALVEKALKDPDLARADTLILVADLKAIPMEQRPNPIEGKDAYIDMEPLTPKGTEPFSFATGRLFHDDLGVVALMLARPRLLTAPSFPRKALVVSNPGGSLPLLETFSRNTIKELFNGGYETTALLGNDVNKDDLRRLLPEQDIFLWEGHYNTLVKDYGLHEWTEPLRPSLVFLQSCLALQESKAQPFLQRGALGVVGASTRTYSASGGACSLAFFDALLYEGQSLGGSLRHAKNFLLAYSLLKEKRLGANAKLTGANVRSAWAFSLWGDPTLKLPRPLRPDEALAPVRHQVRGNTIVVSLPDATHEKAVSAKYKAQMLPNGRLAGLLTKDPDGDQRRLVPFVFVEVHLPKAPPGQMPRLHSRLPSSQWVFCWDRRRQCGYLLVTPRDKDPDELRFRIDWEV